MLFEKKVTIYKKKDREHWTEIRDALKAAGIKGMKASHYLQDSVIAGGCGAKLDPRDFGGGGKVDRDIYYIQVPSSEEERVREILRENGLTAEVEDAETLMTDAALRVGRKES